MVFLDRQHAGKRGTSIDDRGAWGDLDHDGKQELEEQEAFWTARYLWHAEKALLQRGHKVIPLSDGWYSERHARVNVYAPAHEPSVYLAAHFNSLLGGRLTTASGDYGTFFFDHRSDPRLGPALAKVMAFHLRDACPELDDVKTWPARPTDWTSRAFSTIQGVRSSIALCCEPGFIDQFKHARLFCEEGMSRIGQALADGIDDWGGTR